MALRERLKFLPNDDRSIDNGFALNNLCLGISHVQEHETAAERKSHVQFTRQPVELVQTTLLIRTDHGTKQENVLEMWRRSPQRFIVSVLYFVVVDRGVVFENGFDKQENRDERTANFQSREPRRDRITAANKAQKRYGNSRT